MPPYLSLLLIWGGAFGSDTHWSPCRGRDTDDTDRDGYQPVSADGESENRQRSPASSNWYSCWSPRSSQISSTGIADGDVRRLREDVRHHRHVSPHRDERDDVRRLSSNASVGARWTTVNDSTVPLHPVRLLRTPCASSSGRRPPGKIARDRSRYIAGRRTARRVAGVPRTGRVFRRRRDGFVGHFTTPPSAASRS